jgi:sulfatase maturation enzyme AslB (radical SAM superfamily)
VYRKEKINDQCNQIMRDLALRTLKGEYKVRPLALQKIDLVNVDIMKRVGREEFERLSEFCDLFASAPTTKTLKSVSRSLMCIVESLKGAGEAKPIILQELDELYKRVLRCACTHGVPQPIEAQQLSEDLKKWYQPFRHLAEMLGHVGPSPLVITNGYYKCVLPDLRTWSPPQPILEARGFLLLERARVSWKQLYRQDQRFTCDHEPISGLESCDFGPLCVILELCRS